jgi:FlaA1/EpsC-like NDP-sugar epimerase
MVAPSIEIKPSELFRDRGKRNARKKLFWLRFPFSKGLQLTVDLVILFGAFVTAYLLRFDFNPPQNEILSGLIQLPFVVLMQLLALRLAGVYSFIWRYVGMAELTAFLKAALCSSLPLLFLRLALPESLIRFRVPISIILMDTVLAFGLTLGVRVLRRALYERYERQQASASSVNEEKKAVLLIGAGRAGVMTAREIFNRGDLNLEIKGFVDDDPNKQGAVIHGVKVLGKTEDLPDLVNQYEIQQVVIAVAQITRKQMRRLLDICEVAKVKVKIIPGLYDILQGRVNVSRLRNVQVEDLLARDQVSLNEDDMEKFLAGKVVMVTGAGGSIGSELVRQIARFQPATLLLVERAEFALFNIAREIQETWPDLSVKPQLADISDDARMRAIFTAYRPQVILHAAAHKHVPMMELTPTEAIKNNTLGTYTIGKLAGEYDAEAFVLISTDKAVRPTSVMGASKRMAELVVQFLNRSYVTRYVAVRFGNVIGSAGSVIPIFQDQIRKGGPVTVTHPDMTRYFMTIPEASQLVLQAGAMGEGGEIFILDMGEPVNILELAKDTITLTGLKPYEEIDIVFTGVRPGEKLYEELEIIGEEMTKTRHPKIYIGNIASFPGEVMGHALRQLAILSKQGNDTRLRTMLSEFIPEAQLTGSNHGKEGPITSLRPQVSAAMAVGERGLDRSSAPGR